MTVYEFAKACMKDKEFNCGGIIRNEQKYLNAVGFSYTVEDGTVRESEDLKLFYEAMYTLYELQKKYAK